MLTFELRLPINIQTMAQLKSELWRAIPNVKSSHRAEAVARALGLPKRASLLAIGELDSVLPPPINCQAFERFLLDRGYDFDRLSILRSAARVAIKDVMAREPRLSYWGYGIGPPQRQADGKWETSHERFIRFGKERKGLLDDSTVDEFLRALSLLQILEPTKTINSKSNSYSLKHVAEVAACRFPDGSKLGPHYVANGALIVAAVHSGLKYRTFDDHWGYKKINVSLNVSQRSIEDAMLIYRPDRLTEDQRRRAEARRRKVRC
jgi:hypothetical protein